MSLVIQPCAGYVHIMSQDNGGTGKSIYSIDGFSPSVSAEGACFLTGVSLGFSEIVQPSVTLDNARTLYVFGSAWNEVSVSGLLLLGASGSKNCGKILGALTEWYGKNRVGESPKAVGVSMFTAGSINAYVVGLSVGQVNPEYNKQEFAIKLLTAESLTVV